MNDVRMVLGLYKNIIKMALQKNNIKTHNKTCCVKRLMPERLKKFINNKNKV